MSVLDNLTSQGGLSVSTSSEVGEDGVARTTTVVSLGGSEIGTATWTLTPGLSCTFSWVGVEGAPRLSFLRGWEK